MDLLCLKIKIKSRSRASRLKPVLQSEAIPQGVRGAFSGTGFSREEASPGADIFADSTPSRWERACSRMLLLLLLIFKHKTPRRRQSRLGCRPNADDAEWAERHGCRESAVRTWMSVRRGPTERRRSEGIPTKEEPSQEQAPLVTWGAFPSNSPKAKPRPLGRRC